MSGVARSSRFFGGTVALSVVLLVAGCGNAADNQPTTGLSEHHSDGMHGAVLDDQYRMPDVSLTATDDASYSLTKDTSKPVTLVFFGYTHCPDICQVVMADIASALTRLDDAERNQVGMLFITTDPARDDPAKLRSYLDRFNPDFEGLTGDLDQIIKVADELGVAVEKGERMPSGGYEVAHGTQIIAIDERDRAPLVWTEGTPAGDLAADITTLLDGGVPTEGSTT